MEINNIGEITKELYDATPENVVAVGYGRKMVDGKITSELSIIFGVTEKKPLSEIPEDEILPSTVLVNGENVNTDVVEWEIPRFLVDCPTDFYDWQITPPTNRGLSRPIVGGVSITNYNKLEYHAGTMGFIAVDNQTNSLVGVTNAHVLIDDPFLASERTKNSLTTNVANTDVTQPSSGESGYVGVNNKVGIVKRYNPILETPSVNTVDSSIFTLDEDDINTSTSYQQMGLVGWTSPLTFATQSEILNLVINNTPLYSSGRTTGAKGEGDMKLIPYAIGVTTTVSGNEIQGVSVNTVFQDCIRFIASGSTTPTGYSCPYPIAAGDSGSALIGEFGGVRKIVGLNFAGDNYNGFANYITNVATAMDISPYTGQTVGYSDIDNIEYHYVSGKSSDISLTLSGNTYWQVGLNNCTIPPPTPTPTPTQTVTPTLSECSLISNNSFEIFADCGGSCTGFYCLPPVDQRFYPNGCIPNWSGLTISSIEVWKSGYLGSFSYDGGYHVELNGNGPAFHSIYQTINTTNGQDYRIEFAHSGRYGFPNTMKVALSGTTSGVVFFPDTYTGTVSNWVEHTIDFTASETEYNLIFSATTSNAGGNFLDAIDVKKVDGVCAPFATPTPTPTVTMTVTPTSTLTLTPTLTVTPTLDATVTPTVTPTFTLTPTLTVTPTITPTTECQKPTGLDTYTLVSQVTVNGTSYNFTTGSTADAAYAYDLFELYGAQAISSNQYDISSITLGEQIYTTSQTNCDCLMLDGTYWVFDGSFNNPNDPNVLIIEVVDCLITLVTLHNPATPTPTPTVTITLTPTVTPTLTITQSITPTYTPTVTETITPTLTVTPTYTPTVTETITPTLTVTPTYTPTVTETITPTPTPTEVECICYSLFTVSGEGGTVSYTSCEGEASNIVVSANVNYRICSRTAPVPSSGDMVITNNGNCTGGVCPTSTCECVRVNAPVSDFATVYIAGYPCGSNGTVMSLAVPSNAVTTFCVEVGSYVDGTIGAYQDASLTIPVSGYSLSVSNIGSGCLNSTDCSGG
jgi:hypothetical protein